MGTWAAQARFLKRLETFVSRLSTGCEGATGPRLPARVAPLRDAELPGSDDGAFGGLAQQQLASIARQAPLSSREEALRWYSTV